MKLSLAVVFSPNGLSDVPWHHAVLLGCSYCGPSSAQSVLDVGFESSYEYPLYGQHSVKILCKVTFDA